MSMTPLKLDLAHRLDIGFRPKVHGADVSAQPKPARISSPAIQADRFHTRFRFVHVWIVHNDAAVPDAAPRSISIATLPREWSLLYEQKNYVEVDPRIAVAQEHCGACALGSRHRNADHAAEACIRSLLQFLNDASAYGIQSGVAWGVRNPGNHGVIVGLNCRAKRSARYRGSVSRGTSETYLPSAPIFMNSSFEISSTEGCRRGFEGLR